MDSEMDLKDLDQVSGGLIVESKEGATAKYWLVRQNGTVIGPAPDKEHAVSYAKQFAVSTEIITAEEYKIRFGRELKW